MGTGNRLANERKDGEQTMGIGFRWDLGLGLWIWRCGWASGLMTTMGRNSNTKMEVETIVRIAEGMRLNKVEIEGNTPTIIGIFGSDTKLMQPRVRMQVLEHN